MDIEPLGEVVFQVSGSKAVKGFNVEAVSRNVEEFHIHDPQYESAMFKLHY